MQRGSRMERWPSGSAAAASEVTTVSTAANVPSTFHAQPQQQQHRQQQPQPQQLRQQQRQQQ